MHGHVRCLELLVLSGARLTESGVHREGGGGAGDERIERRPGFSKFHADAHDVCFLRHIIFERRLADAVSDQSGQHAVEAEKFRKSMVICEEMQTVMNTHSNDVRNERNTRVMQSLSKKMLKYLPFLIILTLVALGSTKKLSW